MGPLLAPLGPGRTVSERMSDINEAERAGGLETQDLETEDLETDELDADLDDEDLDEDLDDRLDHEDDLGNRITGAIPLAVLDFLARSIVDDPDAIDIEVDESRGRVDLRLTVAPDDMGKIIGRRGRVAQAIRTLVRAAGAREGIEAGVEIVD